VDAVKSAERNLAPPLGDKNRGRTMAKWRLALLAGVVSFAVSSISAFGQVESGRGYIGGGLSFTQPLGGSGRATIRPWINSDTGSGGATSSPGFSGSDVFGSSAQSGSSLGSSGVAGGSAVGLGAGGIGGQKK
jgi:hypothetical protein